MDEMVKVSAIKLDLSHQHAIQGTHWKCTWCSFGLATSKNDEDHSVNWLEPELTKPMAISTEEIHGFNTFQATLLVNLSADDDVARYAHPTQSASITSHLFTSPNPHVNFCLKK